MDVNGRQLVSMDVIDIIDVIRCTEDMASVATEDTSSLAREDMPSAATEDEIQETIFDIGIGKI